MLTQTIDGQVVQAWPIRRIQLWTQDAQDALAANSLGLRGICYPFWAPLPSHSCNHSGLCIS
jgi:hypothetical protein